MLRQILDAIGPGDQTWMKKARQRTSQLVIPHRALGRLHDIAERLCMIRKTLHPSIDRPAVVIMAGDHGVVAEGVSAYPQTVTGEMVRTFLVNGAGINSLARHAKAEVWVVDVAVASNLDVSSTPCMDRFLLRKVVHGTANLAQGPAMTGDQAERALIDGFEIASERFENGVEILVTGDMGIGNTTAAAAIGSVITGSDPETMVGRGAGLDEPGQKRKVEIVRRGIQVNCPDKRNGLDVLRKVGGAEIAGIAGCVLAGAHHQRPVVLDGLISTAGALVAHAICPAVSDYLFAGHLSEEPGHRIILDHMRLEPILDLGMRLGEGSGGALALGIIQAANRVFQQVLTFEEAGVSGKVCR